MGASPPPSDGALGRVKDSYAIACPHPRGDPGVSSTVVTSGNAGCKCIFLWRRAQVNTGNWRTQELHEFAWYSAQRALTGRYLK